MRATLSHHILTYSSHLDLFLEVGTERKLLTYECSITKLEDFYAGLDVMFLKKQDHRYIYLDFEGNISKNRGFLKILWKGYYKQRFEYTSKNIEVTIKNNELHIVS